MRYVVTGKAEEAALFSAATRLETWQTELSVGDHFIIAVQDGIVLYGTVIEDDLSEGPSHPRFRRAMVYSEANPLGAEDILDLYMVDLPMRHAQFEAARTMGWPTKMSVVKFVMRLGPQAQA